MRVREYEHLLLLLTHLGAPYVAGRDPEELVRGHVEAGQLGLVGWKAVARVERHPRVPADVRTVGGLEAAVVGYRLALGYSPVDLINSWFPEVWGEGGFIRRRKFAPSPSRNKTGQWDWERERERTACRYVSARIHKVG